ncbi:hypothetical protein [Nioella nitratireducens]|uniref:hypothetical protein n=1 Tax=Nioella nitratireducens TaxID=1287720 RepID=UPI0008FD793B|nr:hypothetical protein [Nioella nitratireducens]
MSGLMKWGGALLFGFALLFGVNYFRVNAPAQDAARTAEVWAYYRFGVLPSEIVFDVRDLSPSASAASVIGDLLRFSAELQDREFGAVHLAWRGETRFILPGSHFRTLGREYAFQNPAYTIRTLPQHLLGPDGRPAYSTWSGGMLGVLGAQMEDVNGFAADWFVDDYISSR